VVLSLPLMYVLNELVRDIFTRMAVFYALVVPAALVAVRLDWKKLLRLDAKMAGLGVLLGFALYGLGWIGFALLRAVWPEFAGQSATFYGWLRHDDSAVMWLLILGIIVGEEIVWRAVVTLPLSDRWGYGGVLAGAAGFAAVHLPWGPPLLLLAAFVFGGCWSLVIYKTRSFWCALVSHLLWDFLVMWAIPYAG
jgi:membrane protease YdiL (CAAX protease family)